MNPSALLDLASAVPRPEQRVYQSRAATAQRSIAACRMEGFWFIERLFRGRRPGRVTTPFDRQAKEGKR